MPKVDTDLSFDDWLQHGYDRGYCSDTFCATHEEPPRTVAEADDEKVWEDGCTEAVRLWLDRVGAIPARRRQGGLYAVEDRPTAG